ncbi:MAG: type II toxin-antitoxin system PemK/MazF family toxin [Patescibacteria group bacterium]
MKQGDIVPIAFPFSDLSARKMRPALVLSNDSYNKHRNLILAGIYGKKKPHSIPITNAELIRKKLNKDSFISFQNIFSAERTLVGKPVDALSAKKLDSVLRGVRDCF